MVKTRTNTLFTFQEVLFGMGGLGVVLFGIACLANSISPWAYPVLILVEGVFFATPHFFSTFVRVLSDRAEIQRYRFVAVGLPFLLFAGLFGWTIRFGMESIWIFGSLYFYWQWWHHARQSFGLGRYYQGRDISPDQRRLNDFALWAVAILGIALKSSFASDYYQGFPVRTVHLPISFLVYVFLACLTVIVFYLYRQVPRLVHDPSSRAFFTHWLIQSFVFVVFFGLLPSDIGIVAASLWHCTQYITYVYRHLGKKFRRISLGSDFLSRLFHPEYIYLYLGGLLILALIKFQIDRQFIFPLQVTGLAFAYSLAINFQHYILDGILWNRKEVDWSLGRSHESARATGPVFSGDSVRLPKYQKSLSG